MFEEIDHTADYAMHVRATDLATLFVEAARGMNALTGGEVVGPPAGRDIHVQAADVESLLVTWLEELAFLMETEGQMYDEFEIVTISSTSLQARARGGSTGNLEKLIKGVTFHNLAVVRTKAGYETTIVFDV